MHKYNRFHPAMPALFHDPALPELAAMARRTEALAIHPLVNELMESELAEEEAKTPAARPGTAPRL